MTATTETARIALRAAFAAFMSWKELSTVADFEGYGPKLAQQIMDAGNIPDLSPEDLSAVTDAALNDLRQAEREGNWPPAIYAPPGFI